MAIVALLGIADTYWNHDHRWRATLIEAVFPFYIIHQTLIILTGWWLLPFALSPAFEFMIILTATVAGCWLFYIVGRSVAPLRPLIGLKPAAASFLQPPHRLAISLPKQRPVTFLQRSN